ncbi:hypothetical protein [uncultured Sunxiuqinia sp.]|uniref:hypothetical protein n=1 Tax=uncultured Sunxiuqinia sp. TaxID=1573825 RepID=UPI002639765D|nr:hypothetical protein [uncultured Sunxiuqinia sp.]
MTHTIKMFIKIGAKEHIQDLYDNGTIYINTIEYFRKVEDEELRGDKYEGATEIINSLPGTFRIPGIDRDFSYEKVHLKKAYEEVLGNMYSLYCISSKGFQNPLDFRMDEKNLRFGTHCLLIKDNQYFFDRIKSELRKNNYEFLHGFVEYYDKDKVSKKLTLFDKPMEFEYQKEFRFYVHNQEIKPIIIQIGSLKGKAEIIEANKLTELKLELKK